jgi:UDP:flavonoid glycosyltransferase YjiC (YdhE family)
MRVLLTCLPALGHFHPMAPLAEALEAAGHEAVFATSASFAPVVRHAGFEVETAGLDWLESEAERAFPDLMEDPTDLELYTTRHIWPRVFARAAEPMLRDLVELMRSRRPDVVVSAGIEFSGPLAAEACGVPHVRMGIDSFRPLSALGPGLGAYLEQARARLGLPPDPNLERFCPWLYLDIYPPSMQRGTPEEMLPVTRAVRPQPFVVRGAELPGWLAEPCERPLVLVTMGTIFNRVQGTFETVLRGLSDLPVEVVVTVGPNRDPALLGPQPPNVRVERFVPLPALLERTAVVICHAPYNTTIAALSAGVPMLCVPFAGDQLYNAFRVAACGAGLRLDWGRLTPVEIGTAVSRLLDEPVYRLGARRLAAEIGALPPVSSAVSLLQEVAAGRPVARNAAGAGAGRRDRDGTRSTR